MALLAGLLRLTTGRWLMVTLTTADVLTVPVLSLPWR